MRLFTILVIACCATPASAETVTGTIPVSLTVLNSCRLVTAPLSFSTQAGSSAEGQSAIEVTCSGATPVEVMLDSGLNASGTQPRMVGADGTYVPYRIYADPAGVREWSGQAIGAAVEPANALRLMAYGRIEGAETLVPHGEYRDGVTVTLSF